MTTKEERKLIVILDEFHNSKGRVIKKYHLAGEDLRGHPVITKISTGTAKLLKSYGMAEIPIAVSNYV